MAARNAKTRSVHAQMLTDRASPLERVNDCVHAVPGADERDAGAALDIEDLRLAVAPALGTGPVLLVARAVADANVHGYASAPTGSAYFPVPLSAA